MADEPQKAAPVAESEKTAPEIDHEPKNGTSLKTDKPKDAAGSKEADRSHRGNDHYKPKYENKVKTNYDALPASRDPAEIRKQVEFYFSDSNLNYDDYMRKLTGGPANNPVPLSSIHSFKRMRRFQPVGAVVAALRESATLAVVDSKGNPAPDAAEDEAESKNGFCTSAYIVRRTAWVPVKETDDDVTALDDPGLPRSIYAKGFGAETTTTQFDVEAYFAPFGPVNMVRLRRKMPERSFKGSAFVEFATEELAQKFLDSTERPPWAGDVELKVMSKRKYLEKQEEDIKAGKIGADKQSKYKMYQSKDDRLGGKRGDRNGGGRGGRRDDRRDDRHGRDRRDDRNGRKYDRKGRNGRDDRDRRNGRDDDDWKGRRDDFQKSLKDEEDSAQAETTVEPKVDAEPATARAPSPKRVREEEGEAEAGGEAKRARVEDAAGGEGVEAG